MDVTDRVCNLECVKGGKVQEFVGPVKIVLVDPPEGEYLKKTCTAGLVALANMMMGATTFVVLLYTLSFKLSFINNLHVFLCTVGFQLFIPSGILMLNNLNGASSAMKESDRKFQHFFLQAVGLGCAGTGSVSVFLLGKTSQSKFSLHFLVGFVTCVLAVLSTLGGPASYFIQSEGTIARIFKSLHTLFGVIAFVASSACFISGIVKNTFTSWLPLPETLYILMLFCAFYTFVVIYTPIIKYISGKNDE